MFHNETVNIWSHFLGAVFLIGVTISVFLISDINTTPKIINNTSLVSHIDDCFKTLYDHSHSEHLHSGPPSHGLAQRYEELVFSFNHKLGELKYTIGEGIEEVKHSIFEKAKLHLKEIERIKMDLEGEIVQQVHGMQVKLNT